MIFQGLSVRIVRLPYMLMIANYIGLLILEDMSSFQGDLDKISDWVRIIK